MDSATSQDPRTTTVIDRLSDDLEALRRRVSAASAAADRDVLVQDLEAAYEELRAADEEVRAQNETIERLASSRKGLRLQQERVLAVLPVPVILTDGHGAIRTVNAAAAVAMGLRVDRLLGKPFFACFAADDRRALRGLLAQGHRGVVGRRVSTLVPRGAAPRAVEVVVTSQLELGDAGEVCWILLAGGGADAAETPGGVIEALAALALLPQGGSDRRELLEKAARIIGGTLRSTVGVSLVVGSPAEPAAVASSTHEAQHWDGAQVASGDGPSVTAFRSGLTVSGADLANDPRWPGLGRHAGPGTVSAVAVPVQYAERTVGVVTAYGAAGAAVVPTEVVELFAVTVGGVLHELELVRELDRLESDMHRALATRGVIDQAKGIIMGAHGVDATAAWDHLLQLSSGQHLKVRDLAQRIVDQAARSA